MNEGGLWFIYPGWESSVCKDSARPWWDPHSPSDIWEAERYTSWFKEGGDGVDGFLGRRVKSLRASESCSPSTHLHLHGQNKPGTVTWMAAEWNPHSILSINSLDSHTYTSPPDFCRSLHNSYERRLFTCLHSSVVKLPLDIARLFIYLSLWTLCFWAGTLHKLSHLKWYGLFKVDVVNLFAIYSHISRHTATVSLTWSPVSGELINLI